MTSNSEWFLGLDWIEKTTLTLHESEMPNSVDSLARLQINESKSSLPRFLRFYGWQAKRHRKLATCQALNSEASTRHNGGDVRWVLPLLGSSKSIPAIKEQKTSTGGKDKRAKSEHKSGKRGCCSCSTLTCRVQFCKWHLCSKPSPHPEKSRCVPRLGIVVCSRRVYRSCIVNFDLEYIDN